MKIEINNFNLLLVAERGLLNSIWQMDVSKNPTNLISSFYIGDCTINVTEM
jgi:hypothetical protein